MPVPTTYTEIAINCPAILIPTAVRNPQNPTDYPGIAPGPKAGVWTNLDLRPEMNGLGTFAEGIAAGGAGGFAIIKAAGNGLAMTDGGGPKVNIATGAAMICGPVPPSADHADLADGTYNYLWLSQGGAFVPATSSDHTAPPAPPGSLTGLGAYVGRVKVVATAVTEIDRSGVLEFRGGLLYRKTADVGAPTDTPPATLMLITETACGCWLWNGTQHVPVGPDGAPALTADAEAANAITVHLQARDGTGNAVCERRRVRVLIADAQWGAECAAAPDGGVTLDTGTLWQVITGDKQFEALTNAVGQAVFTLTESTAKSFWVHAEQGGKVTALQVTFV